MSLAVYMDVPAAVAEVLRSQQHGTPFSGVLIAPQGTPISQMIEDAELCLAGLTADEFRNRLVHLPLR
jgi:hypothetical protein